MFADRELLQREAPINVVGWGSHRLKRERGPSMSAEAISSSEGVRHALFLRAILSELLQTSFGARFWERDSASLTSISATGCRSVFDHVARDRGLPSCKYLAAELASLKRDM